MRSAHSRSRIAPTSSKPAVFCSAEPARPCAGTRTSRRPISAAEERTEGVIRQVALSAAVLVIATILLAPRIGGAVWLWLAIAAVIWAIAVVIIRARR